MTGHIHIVAADPAAAGPESVRLASVDAYDAPVAFRLRDTEGALGRAGLVEVRSHGDRLWRRYGERHGLPPLSGGRAIADAASDPDRHDNPFGTGPDVPASERAGQLLVIDGDLWEQVGEPVAVLLHDVDGGVPHVAFRWEGPTDPADTYRIDEVELAAACSRHPLQVPLVQVLMPECVRHDATGALLSLAAAEVAEWSLERGAVPDPRLAPAMAGVTGPGTLDDILDAARAAGITRDHPQALVAAVARATADPVPTADWDGPEPSPLSRH